MTVRRAATAAWASMSLLALTTGFAIAAEPAPTPVRQTGKMSEDDCQVTRSLLIPAPPGKAIMLVTTSYTQSAGDDLIQEYSELEASDTVGAFYVRFSGDNGKSWTDPKETYAPKSTKEGISRQGESAFLLDPKSGRLIRFFNQHIYPGGTHTRAVVGLTTIQYQVSHDGGKTFSSPRQIICRGHTPEAWAPGVKYGENSAMISFCAPFFDRRGKIILPTERFHNGDPSISARRLPLDAGCFIGELKDDDTIAWELGGMVEADVSVSTRGFCEPAIAELADGRFLLVSRGSNVLRKDLPSRKWSALSEDGGRTWSPVKAWTYDAGEDFFSPASGSRLIRSSKNGSLYWIGNISPHNGYGNDPRYPLVIGKVDEASGRLIKSTVSPVAVRNPGVGERLQFSNFKVHEDRETGDFLIDLAPLYETSDTDLTTPSYEYRVKIPPCSGGL